MVQNLTYDCSPIGAIHLPPALAPTAAPRPPLWLNAVEQRAWLTQLVFTLVHTKHAQLDEEQGLPMSMMLARRLYLGKDVEERNLKQNVNKPTI